MILLLCIWCQRARSDFNVINMVSMVTHPKTWSSWVVLHELHKSNGAFHKTDETTSSDQLIVHWRIRLGEGDRKHTPSVQKLFTFVQFLGKNCHKIMLAPPLGEDWISHYSWMVVQKEKKLSNALPSPLLHV